MLEVVSIDSLSLYVRIYSDEPLSDIFPNGTSNQVENQPKRQIKVGNGSNITVENHNNMYTFISIPRYSYYVGYGTSDNVEHLYTKGLPFAKSFKKSMKQYFKNCPKLIEKVEEKEFTNDNLVEVLEF